MVRVPQPLARLPQLACLDLSGCNHLTGAALAPIGTVTCLQTLKLQHCLRCTRAVFHLTQTPFSSFRQGVWRASCTCLPDRLSETIIKIRHCLPVVPHLTPAQTVRMVCSMGAPDLAELRALHDLASLSLRGCPSLAAAGVSSLATLTALRCLPQISIP